MKPKSLFTTTINLLTVLSVTGTNTTRTFTNPLRTLNGSDPFLVYTNGYYYLATTTWRSVELTRSRTLEGLKTAAPQIIYRMPNPNPAGGNDVWVPELHDINGTWHMYFSEGRKSRVLPGTDDPWRWEPYGLGSDGTLKKSPIQVHQEWGIDGTIVDVPRWGKYFVWSCMAASPTVGEEDLQSLCIARLVTPTSIGPFSTLSQPLEEWERVEIPVNEGPAGLYHGGRVWIAYAASFCKTIDYAIGTLAWDGVGDPLKAGSWKKSNGRVFSSANGNYGTAHNG